MRKLKVVRVDGKRLTLSKANLNQLASIASLGIDFKAMKGEDIGEAAPLMVDILKECLHSTKYEITDSTAIEWMNNNLDIDALADEAEFIVQNKMIDENGSDADDYGDLDERVDHELNLLVESKMPNIVFLGDMGVQDLARLFALAMPKKKATKRSKKAKAG